MNNIKEVIGKEHQTIQKTVLNTFFLRILLKFHALNFKSMIKILEKKGGLRAYSSLRVQDYALVDSTQDKFTSPNILTTPQ